MQSENETYHIHLKDLYSMKPVTRELAEAAKIPIQLIHRHAGAHFIPPDNINARPLMSALSREVGERMCSTKQHNQSLLMPHLQCPVLHDQPRQRVQLLELVQSSLVSGQV